MLVRHTVDLLVAADRIGLEELDNLAEEDSLLAEVDNPDRSSVAGTLGCNPLGRVDRKART